MGNRLVIHNERRIRSSPSSLSLSNCPNRHDPDDYDEMKNVNHVEWFIPPVPEEIHRLQTRHFLLHHIWQSNFSAPEMEERLVRGDARVLELGCGPGTWILEMASNYSSASFTGVDICPTFPSEIKPLNATFIQANLIDGIPYPDGYFDFVCMRFLAVVFKKDQWIKVIKELVRVMKPGGIIEIMEIDIPWSNEGPIGRKLISVLTQDLYSRGVVLTAQQVSELLESNQSLLEIHQDERTWHFGKWAGRVGELTSEITIQMFRLLKYRYASMLNLSDDDYEILLSSLIDEFEQVKPFAKSYRFWATKALV